MRRDRRGVWRAVAVIASVLVFVPLLLWAFQIAPLGLPCLAWPVMSFMLVIALGMTRTWAQEPFEDGACAACGYDRAGLDGVLPCPACGETIRHTPSPDNH